MKPMLKEAPVLREDALEESKRLIIEAQDYMERGMPAGVSWRLADALYWLKVGLDQDGKELGGIGKPTGLGNILKNVYTG